MRDAGQRNESVQEVDRLIDQPVGAARVCAKYRESKKDDADVVSQSR